MNKEGNFRLVGLVVVITFIIASMWDKWVWMKDGVHAFLDPTLGVLLNWNMTWGMLIIVLMISYITILVQKYGTDQKTLKELKKEQKILQNEMKKYKNHPEKLMSLQKQQRGFIGKTMKLSTRTIIYTGIPFILFYRWFDDYFKIIALSTGHPARFFGFLGWFLFYLIFTMIFSSIIKKKMDVV